MADWFLHRFHQGCFQFVDAFPLSTGVYQKNISIIFPPNFFLQSDTSQHWKERRKKRERKKDEETSDSAEGLIKIFFLFSPHYLSVFFLFFFRRVSFDLIGAVRKRCSGVCKLGDAVSFDVDQEQCALYTENKSAFQAQRTEREREGEREREREREFSSPF